MSAAEDTERGKAGEIPALAPGGVITNRSKDLEVIVGDEDGNFSPEDNRILNRDVDAKQIFELAENHGAEENTILCTQPRELPAALSGPQEDDKTMKGIVRKEVNALLQQGTFRSENLTVGALPAAAAANSANNNQQVKPVHSQQDTPDIPQLSSVPGQSNTVEEIMDLIEHQKHEDTIAKGAVAVARNLSNQTPMYSSTVEELMDMIEHQKHQDAITKGAVVVAQNSCQAPCRTANPNPDPSVPMPPDLFRERPVVPVSQPGAVAVGPILDSTGEQVLEDGPAFSDTDEEAAALSPAQEEYLLDASVVSDHQERGNSKELVEAVPALEGLEAMVQNRDCKRIAAAILLFVVLVIVIPLSIFLPGSGSDTIILDGVDEAFLGCGTRERYQADYRGLEKVTELGIECQDWNMQFPHQHEHTPDAYPDANLVKNYCRNPAGGDQPRVWCYTKDPQQRWAYCDVQFCNEDPYEFRDDCATILLGGYDYRGNVSVSATGKTCLPWNETGLPINPQNFPNAGLESNYCRNPDSNQPYCFVDDPNNPKEPCDLPRCKEFFQGSENTCHNCTQGECGTLRLKMTDYRGTVNVTQKGVSCRPWTERHWKPMEWQEFGLEENYCRNPSPQKNGRPWCHTSGLSDFCDVPVCEDDFFPRRFCGSESMYQDDYRGDIKVTTSGKQCLPWTSEYAILIRNNPGDKPWDGLIGSYCRNPQNFPKFKTAGAQSAIKVGAWCHVDHDAEANEQYWEYCDIPFCKDCGTKSLAKADYTGTVSTTMSGRRCLPWERREHFLTQVNDTLNMEVEVEGNLVLYRFGIRKKHSLEENYCRNPLPHKRDTVFCFVDEDGGWEYCDTPDCEEPGTATSADCGSQAERQADYRGEINITVSGRPCRPWELQEEYTAERFPTAGLDASYCRQPAGSSRLAAWCFVNESKGTWEYCDVPICEE